MVFRSIRALRSLVLLLAGTCALTGCVTRPTMNEPLANIDAHSGVGYRYENLELGQDNSEELIVALTFSGGGTRAAAFAYGVLEQLRETSIGSGEAERNLLNEVDVISSVSGGSLTSAAYGLYGEEIFDNFLEDVLYANLQGTIVRKLFDPFAYAKFWSPYYGRSDMLADTFDKYFLEATFGDLVARDQRPFIIINSTDMTLGQQFSFTQFYFDYLYSNLSTYPISRAVAASAAVPGALTSMTLHNFPKPPEYMQPEWIRNEIEHGKLGTLQNSYARDYSGYSEPENRYIHLVDGGISDNLGLLPIIQIVADFPAGMTKEAELVRRGAKKVLVITVNSKKTPKNDWGTKEKTVGLFQILGATSVSPMGDFSVAQIEYMRLLHEKREVVTMLNSIVNEHNLDIDVPGDDISPIEYRFVDLSFQQIEDPEEREYLLSIPTSFRLSQEEVDRIRAAAKNLLESNERYQAILSELE